MPQDREPAPPVFRGRSRRHQVLVLIAVAVVVALVLPFLPILFG